MADEPEGNERERTPSHDINPEALTDTELERELTITVTSDDPAHLEFYERLLREKAERRARKDRPGGEPNA